MKFIICTCDWSGLGFAMILQREGHEVVMAYELPENFEEKDEREQSAYYEVGEGIVQKIPIQVAIKERSKYRDAYWIFDSNNLFAHADKLKEQDYKVLGASSLTYEMEHDRNFGMSIAKKAGFNIADSQQFHDIQTATSFLENNLEKAFVCKPNDAPPEAHLTYVPAEWETPKEANLELRSYLPALDSTDFILQEKIKGIEVNVECFFYKGTPYFSWVELECKRKNSGDKGELIGCSQDIGFVTEMDNGIVTQIIAKMFPFFKSKQYTGFADVNVLLADNEVYFIEFCNRLGFNAHPCLFLNLCIDPIGETLSAMIDGKIQNFYERFRKGFGASILMYLDHPTPRFPLYVSKDIVQNFYHYESYQDGSIEDPEQQFCLAGYGNEIGIVCGYGFTMKDAAKSALDKALKVNYPLCAYREDLAEEDYPQSPIKRHEALNSMGLIHRHL